MKNDFSKRLKELRNENKFTQRDMALKLNIAHVSYLRWEQGRTEPNIDTICKLCEIFNVSSDYLLGLENEDGTKVYAQDYNVPTPADKKTDDIIVPPGIVGHEHTYHILARSGGPVDITVDAETDAKITALLDELDAKSKKDSD